MNPLNQRQQVSKSPKFGENFGNRDFYRNFGAGMIDENEFGFFAFEQNVDALLAVLV